MHPDTKKYIQRLDPAHRALCDLLAREIDRCLPEAENRVWHAHPVWFLDGNPIVGFSTQKPGIRLMFWSGASFDEAGLDIVGKKFKDASVFFNTSSEVKKADLRRWCNKSRQIQWDYKNLIKRRGRLERIERTPAARAPRAKKASAAAPKIARRALHRMPPDVRKAIASDAAVQCLWDSITPLARNEWICWVTSAKQQATRERRIEVGLDKMRKGMRRPCCWPGCPHR